MKSQWMEISTQKPLKNETGLESRPNNSSALTNDTTTFANPELFFNTIKRLHRFVGNGNAIT